MFLAIYYLILAIALIIVAFANIFIPLKISSIIIGYGAGTIFYFAWREYKGHKFELRMRKQWENTMKQMETSHEETNHAA